MITPAVTHCTGSRAPLRSLLTVSDSSEGPAGMTYHPISQGDSARRQVTGGEEAPGPGDRDRRSPSFPSTVWEGRPTLQMRKLRPPQLTGAGRGPPVSGVPELHGVPDKKSNPAKVISPLETMVTPPAGISVLFAGHAASQFPVTMT